MKKTAAIFCILVFLLQSLGLLLTCKFQQWQIRQEVTREIRNETKDVCFISIVPNSSLYHELTWENPHEFILKGMRYDVISRQEAGDSVTIYRCIKDEKETELLAELFENWHRRSPFNSGEASRKLSKLFSLVFLATYDSKLALADPTACEHPIFSVSSLDREGFIFDPPPDSSL